MFAKAGATGVNDRKANESDCNGSNDKQVDVSGSNSTFHGRLHSNADFAVSGSGNVFSDNTSSPNPELTYGVNDGGGAPCQVQADSGNTYSSGGPTNVTGSGDPTSPQGPYQIGSKGWPGNLGDFLNADGMTFGTDVTQVLGAGATCDRGSLSSNSSVNLTITSADNGRVICNGTGQISIGVSNLGSAANPFKITMISHGSISIGGSNHFLAPSDKGHGILAWTDQAFSTNATSVTLSGSTVTRLADPAWIRSHNRWNVVSFSP